MIVTPLPQPPNSNHHAEEVEYFLSRRSSKEWEISGNNIDESSRMKKMVINNTDDEISFKASTGWFRNWMRIFNLTFHKPTHMVDRWRQSTTNWKRRKSMS